MQVDLTATALYQRVDAFYRRVRRPGSGLISDAAEVTTNGIYAAFSGSIVDELSGTPPGRICLTKLETGETRVLTFGPNCDRLPKFSPDGKQLAFLSDRGVKGDFQLYLLDVASGAASPAGAVEGWVEYFHWAPDGKRILLGAAGHGADVAGAQGAVTSSRKASERASWQPEVETGSEGCKWRRLWAYDLATGQVQSIGPPGQNIWEAAWCGNDAVVMVASPGPEEGLWYTARLYRLDLNTNAVTELYHGLMQLGWPSATPSGHLVAIVEAHCSDRWLVAGDLRLISTDSRKSRRIKTSGIDITYCEWRSDEHLLLAGHRGFETVVAIYSAAADVATEVWASEEIGTSGTYASVAGLDHAGDCVLIGEGFATAPEIAIIRRGQYHRLKSLDVGYVAEAESIGGIERLKWLSTDGLEIQGWLLRPKGTGPHPVVMHVHGGPVFHWHPTWLGRALRAPILLLVQLGYAAFLPNPRGSSGRGQEFAEVVFGDVGGADTNDCLSGLESLVDRGTADPTRLGITGGSYGGFMTAWATTQDARFAAAVAVAPVTNQVTAHLISNIPEYVELSLADSYHNLGGRYFERSPVLHAHKSHTPTLNICGALDRCTPPEEAIQFHRALSERGTKSVLVKYPEEGHGIRTWPAAIDYAARVMTWFLQYMPVDNDAHLPAAERICAGP